MSQSELLKKVVAALEATGTPYMLNQINQAISAFPERQSAIAGSH